MCCSSRIGEIVQCFDSVAHSFCFMKLLTIVVLGIVPLANRS